MKLNSVCQTFRKNRIQALQAGLLTLAVLVLPGQAFAESLPDITGHDGVMINGRHVAWGGMIVLTQSQASTAANGYCTFSQVYYSIINNSKVATGPFRDVVRAAYEPALQKGGNFIVVGSQSDLTLQAGEGRSIRTQELHLLSGKNIVSFFLDDGNAVREANENNNVLRIIVDVQSACGKQQMGSALRTHTRIATPSEMGLKKLPKPNLSAFKQLPDIAGYGGISVNGKHVAWGGTLVLTNADASTAGHGNCNFENVYYDITNRGNVSTAKFRDFVFSGYHTSINIGSQDGLVLQAHQTRRIRTQEFHMPPGKNLVVFKLDVNNSVKESNERNNQLRVTVDVRDNCMNTSKLSKPLLKPLLRRK